MVHDPFPVDVLQMALFAGAYATGLASRLISCHHQKQTFGARRRRRDPANGRVGDDEELLSEVLRRHKRGEDAAVRGVHRKYFGSAS